VTWRPVNYTIFIEWKPCPVGQL